MTSGVDASADVCNDDAMAQSELEDRLKHLIDDRLFEAYWAAVEHFGTTDLILFFDTEREEDPVTAHRRQQLLDAPDAPPSLAKKCSKPAAESASTLTGASTAFWLVASFPDDEMVITAVRAQRLAEGGSA